MSIDLSMALYIFSQEELREIAIAIKSVMNDINSKLASGADGTNNASEHPLEKALRKYNYLWRKIAFVLDEIYPDKNWRYGIGGF